MPDLDFIKAKIERMRNQVERRRREIRQLHGAGISTTFPETLLQRMLDNIEDLGADRDGERAGLPKLRKVLGGRK